MQHLGNDIQCHHGNTARYCQDCEVESLREERLRLSDELDAMKAHFRLARLLALAGWVVAFFFIYRVWS